MKWFELLILNRLCLLPAGGCGCAGIIWILILSVILAFIWEHKIPVIIATILIFIIADTMLCRNKKYSCSKTGTKEYSTNELGNKYKNIPSETLKRINELAQTYIENNLTLPSDELTLRDYQKFEKIILTENHIKLPDDNNTGGYSALRTILYNVYLKKINESKM